MSKPLNFNNVKKQYLTVTLADTKKTTLLVGTPTKAIMNSLISLQSEIEDITEDNTETTDALYEACAKVMSRNKGGIEITKEYLEETFDFEDIMIFFNAYMEFINEAMSLKN